jgi:hypothetical protein
VAGQVCEIIAQNLAQRIFLSKLHNILFLPWERVDQIRAICVFFKNLTKENNHPMRERSSNLVTLIVEKFQRNSKAGKMTPK